MIAFLSNFLIPTLTLVMARETDWFATNFSVISISMARQAEFLLWSLVIGGYFFYTIPRLFKARSRFQSIKKEAVLFATAAWMMVLFVLTPYLPAQLPRLSVIHVLSALLCSLLFFFCLLSLTLKAYWKSPGAYRSSLIVIIAATAFCICAFLLTGIINTAMEICFVITAVLLTKHLLYLEEQDF